jgi:hypothetical protein
LDPLLLEDGVQFLLSDGFVVLLKFCVMSHIYIKSIAMR